jgi:cytidyltransferase-like protein
VANVLTIGTFDLVNSGHYHLLRQCRRIAGVFGSVTVGLNSDRRTEEYRGKPPYHPYSERFAVLSRCAWVDAIALNDDSPDTILKTEPDFIVFGFGWSHPDCLDFLQTTTEWLDERGITVLHVDQTSSAELKDRIRE